jgi:hypothetical protein
MGAIMARMAIQEELDKKLRPQVEHGHIMENR